MENQNSQVQKTYNEVLQEVEGKSFKEQAYALSAWCIANKAGLEKRLASIRNVIKHKKFNKTKGYNYEYISLEDILPVADFLFDIYEIYPSSTVNVEQKEAILSFRLSDSDDLVVVSMVLLERTNAQVKDNCQMQGAIDTYVTRYLLRKALGICDYSDDVDNLPQGGGGGKKQQNKTQAVNTDAKASDGFSNMIDDPTDLDPSMIFNDKQCLKDSTIINWAKKQTKQMLNKIWKTYSTKCKKEIADRVKRLIHANTDFKFKYQFNGFYDINEYAPAGNKPAQAVRV